MAKVSQQLDNLLIPKTRADTYNQVVSAIESKYGWSIPKEQDGFYFNFGRYKTKYRKLSEEQSKATGQKVYIDTRTGQVWDPAYNNQMKASINADKNVLTNSLRSKRGGKLAQGIKSNLQKLQVFNAINRKTDAQIAQGSELGTLNKLLSPTTAEGNKEIDLRREKELNRLDTNIANEQAKLREINTYTPNENQLRLINGEGKTNWERNNEVAQQMDGVTQPNLGRLTIDVNGEVNDQVKQVVNEYIDPNSDNFSQVYKPEEVNRPQDDQPNINAERKKTNNPTDVPDTSTIEENLSNDGIPMKKNWIQSVQDVEDGVTNYQNSEEYRRLLMAKEFASKRLKIKKPDKKSKLTIATDT